VWDGAVHAVAFVARSGSRIRGFTPGTGLVLRNLGTGPEKPHEEWYDLNEINFAIGGDMILSNLQEGYYYTGGLPFTDSDYFGETYPVRPFKCAEDPDIAAEPVETPSTYWFFLKPTSGCDAGSCELKVDTCGTHFDSALQIWDWTDPENPKLISGCTNGGEGDDDLSNVRLPWWPVLDDDTYGDWGAVKCPDASNGRSAASLTVDITTGRRYAVQVGNLGGHDGSVERLLVLHAQITNKNPDQFTLEQCDAEILGNYAYTTACMDDDDDDDDSTDRGSDDTPPEEAPDSTTTAAAPMNPSSDNLNDWVTDDSSEEDRTVKVVIKMSFSVPLTSAQIESTAAAIREAILSSLSGLLQVTVTLVQVSSRRRGLMAVQYEAQTVIVSNSISTASSVSQSVTAVASGSAMESAISSASGQEVVLEGVSVEVSSAVEATNSGSSSSGSGGLSVPVLAGAAGGGALVLVAIIVFVIFRLKKRRREKEDHLHKAATMGSQSQPFGTFPRIGDAASRVGRPAGIPPALSPSCPPRSTKMAAHDSLEKGGRKAVASSLGTLHPEWALPPSSFARHVDSPLQSPGEDGRGFNPPNIGDDKVKNPTYPTPSAPPLLQVVGKPSSPLRPYPYPITEGSDPSDVKVYYNDNTYDSEPSSHSHL